MPPFQFQNGFYPPGLPENPKYQRAMELAKEAYEECCEAFSLNDIIARFENFRNPANNSYWGLTVTPMIFPPQPSFALAPQETARIVQLLKDELSKTASNQGELE